MTVKSNNSVPVNGIFGMQVQREGVLVVASAQKLNFTGNVDVQNVG
jgi:hypothetical protein